MNSFLTLHCFKQKRKIRTFLLDDIAGLLTALIICFALVTGVQQGNTWNLVYGGFNGGRLGSTGAARGAFTLSTPKEGTIVFEQSTVSGYMKIRAMDPDGSNVTTILDNPALNMESARVSQDGSKVVFSAGPANQNDIWIINTNGTGLRNVTAGSGIYPLVEPDLSPDSTKIVFQQVSASMYTVPIGGGALTNLGSPGGEPRWYPDGIRILQSNWGNTYDSDLFVREADGSRQSITNTPGIAEIYGVPSPDGQRIAFVVRNSGLWLMNSDGSGRTFLAQGDSPAWSPDGNKIAFISDRSGNRDIWLINTDGSGLVNLTDTALDEASVSWSRESIPPPIWYSSYDFASKGVIGYWPLDGNANDVSGNGLNGTPINVTNATGRFGECYDFSGEVGTASSRIVLPEHPSVTAYSLSIWVKIDQYRPYSYPDREGVVFFNRRQDYADFYMNATNAHGDTPNGQLAFSHLRGSYVPTNHAEITTPTLSTGVWHHLAGTTDANYTRLYLDGVLVSENASGGAPYWGGSYMGTFLGVNGSLPESLYRSALDGRIDEVAIFNRVMSASEVKALASDADNDGIADFWIAPTGGKIVFQKGAYPNARAWICNLDGGNAAPLTTANIVSFPKIANGTVVFMCDGYQGNSRGIYKMDAIPGAAVSKIPNTGNIRTSGYFNWKGIDISPDGKQVAWIGNEPGDDTSNHDVYVVNIDSSNKTRILRNTNRHYVMLTWGEPDRICLQIKSVGNPSSQRSYTITPDGSNLTQVVEDFAANMHIGGPDGRAVLTLSQAAPYLATYDNEFTSRVSVPEANYKLKHGFSFMSWHPTQNALFGCKNDGNLYRVDVDTGNEALLILGEDQPCSGGDAGYGIPTEETPTPTPTPTPIPTPTPSPLLSKIVFQKGLYPNAQPWICDLDGGNAAQLTTISLVSFPRIANGTVVFMCDDYQGAGPGIYKMDAIPGAIVTRIPYTSNIRTSQNFNWDGVDISPDGQRVAWTGNEPGDYYANHGVYVIGMDGSGKTCILRDTGKHYVMLNWGEPDRICLQIGNVGDAYSQRPYTVTPSGANLTQVVADFVQWVHVGGPQGRAVLTVSQATPYLATYDNGFTTRVALPGPKYGFSYMSWHPTENALFGSKNDGNLYRVDVDTGNELLLVSGAGQPCGGGDVGNGVISAKASNWALY